MSEGQSQSNDGNSGYYLLGNSNSNNNNNNNNHNKTQRAINMDDNSVEVSFHSLLTLEFLRF